VHPFRSAVDVRQHNPHKLPQRHLARTTLNGVIVETFK
jgi:hypothetical protein